ncbi:peptidase M50 [Skermanella stibiiresistens SB22]|uniref:Peptidase M50 n=2 Tax=Skermanella TaxID=204447 RepID=W9H573_9PROT|nr:peptidase M50 [Skermanella stibiiresistens SB22]
MGGQMAGAPAPPARLLPLREELTLHAGPVTAEGSPTWTLHDPANNRFYRIGWLEFEILSRWEAGDMEEIAADIRRSTTLDAAVSHVELVARFLMSCNLLQARGEAALERLTRQAASIRVGPAKWLLKNYLFIRVPLVRPERFLKAALPMVGWVFTRGFLVAVLLMALTGGYLVMRQWDAFLATFPHFFSLEGAALSALALTGAKILHELGHAFTARRRGCRVPTMGVAFLVMWPVLYTDTSEAWKLPSRRHRLEIGAAGMAAELALAAVATLAWSFLPDGPARSAAFLLATSTWLLTLVINLNPFMRFDGYYLLSDYLDIPNLQDRSFALARWRLRELLFGLGDPVPERLPDHTRRVLIAYAFCTWIYRFFLFLGIALLVYHLFFKLLGIFLMMVEMVWFIARPIWSELREWVMGRDKVHVNRNSVATLLGLCCVVALVLVPWRSAIPAAAVLRAEQQLKLFTPRGARLAEVGVRIGQLVTAGDMLFRFDSPDLDHDLAQAERRVQVSRWQVQFQGMSRDLLERNQVSWRELEGAMAQAAGHRTELDKLVLTAPMSGRVVELADPLRTGEWLKANTELATVVDPASGIIEAYVGEADLARIAVGTSGTFHPDDLDIASVTGKVISIDDGSSRTLPEPTLASVNGGDVAVRDARGPEGALIPESPVYRVLIRPDGGLPAPARVQRGRVLLNGERESLIARTWRAGVGVLVRESGF